MSANQGLARFDTRRAAQTEKSSEQTDLRTIGAREHGQLALNELDTSTQAREASQRSERLHQPPAPISKPRWGAPARRLTACANE